MKYNEKSILEQGEYFSVTYDYGRARIMECTGFEGSHQYAEKTCAACGEKFCFSCCGNTNVHEGGKYQEDFMNCPKCGHSYYDKEG